MVSLKDRINKVFQADVNKYVGILHFFVNSKVGHGRLLYKSQGRVPIKNWEAIHA